MKTLLFFVVVFPMLAFAQSQYQQISKQRDRLNWPNSQTFIWKKSIYKDAQYAPANLIIPKNAISTDADFLVLNPTASITTKYSTHSEWRLSNERSLVGAGLLFSAPINMAATIGRDSTNDFKNRLAPLAPDLVHPKHARIMPLGNSITENNEPGYRGYLYEKLKANGYDVDFVGTKKGLPANGCDEDHSGYSGFIVGPGPSKADAFVPPYKGNIFENLDEGYKILSTDCDIILLEIGINDFFNSTDTSYHANSSGAKKLDGLINKIFSLKPDVHLIVSNITPLGGEPNFAKLWNSQLPAIVAKYKKLGSKCYLANLRNGIQWNISKDLGPDKLHPQAAGYKKMADLYYKILTGILSK